MPNNNNNIYTPIIHINHNIQINLNILINLNNKEGMVLMLMLMWMICFIKRRDWMMRMMRMMGMVSFFPFSSFLFLLACMSWFYRHSLRYAGCPVGKVC